MCCAIGNRNSQPEAGQAPRQPSLLPAPRRADDPPDPLLLYEQGFTIGGARQRLEGEATRAAAAAAAPPPIETKVPAELVRQMRIDLEAVLEILR
jgi:hypothetical protein